MINQRNKLLLVEDHEIVAALEMRQLSAIGFQVVHVMTGEAAVDEVRRNHEEIDLILMDINLGPAMSGPAAAEVILASYDLPIIYLTSCQEDQVLRAIDKIYSYGWVSKSAGIAALGASIRSAISAHQASKASREKDPALQ